MTLAQADTRVFGGGTADVTTDAAGNTVGGVQLSVYDGDPVTGAGTQVTDLYDVDMTPLPGYVTSVVSTDPYARGRLTFRASKAYSALFLWDGNPGHAAWALLAREVATLVGTAIDKADQASTDASDALAKANQALTGNLAGAGVANVLAHGADDTGTDDATVQFQAALDEAAGGLLLIPPGTYNISSNLVVHAGTHILAHGAVIRRTAVFSFMRNIDPTDDTTGGYDGAGGIVIEGGIWDNAGGTYNSSYANCFTFAHGKDITVRDLEIRDMAGAHAIELDSCQHVRIENVRFAGYIDTGSRAFSECIQIDVNTGLGDPNDTPTCDDVTVTGCWAGASALLPAPPRMVGSHSNHQSVPHTHIKVLGNHAKGCIQYAVRGYGWSYVLVEGNTVDGGCSSAGIMVETPDIGGAGGGSPFVCADVIVRDNVLHGVGGLGVALNAASGYSVTGAIVEANIIDGAAGDGIRATRAVEAMIRNNRVNAANGAAVSLVSATDPMVQGNRVRKGTGTGTVALSVDSACTGVWRFGNDFRRGQSTITDASTGTVTAATDLTA